MNTPTPSRGVVVWLTGFSGAGKSTIADEVRRLLTGRGILASILDGDVLRRGLCSDLGFSPDDRRENIRRVGEVAKILVDAGVVALVALISPYREDRGRVREKLAEGTFIEVFVDTPLAECERRDPKGLYARARAGKIPEFTGISAPYEPPDAPELHLRAGEADLDACAGEVVSAILSRLRR
ncbi:MAG: adenylyl-sulfate kinase [Nannocystaceae bacterium]